MNELDNRLEKIERKLDDVAFRLGESRMPEGSQGSSDEIDLRELFEVIWRGKWLIIVLVAVFALASVSYALYLPSVYRSQVLLAPAEENSGGGLAGMAGNLSGLASLAGVNLGGSSSDKTTIALEVLKSREFISRFVERHDLLVPLVASFGWNQSQDKLKIDGSIYNEESGQWVRKPNPPRGAKPSSQEAYEAFVEIFNVSKDKETGLVSLGIEYYSPALAKQWVDLLVTDINREIKRRDVIEAEKSIRYLSEQLEKTAISDMKTVFYELIEEQTKTVMFAEVREEYVFKTIDRAVVPEIKSGPSRALIILLGVVLGGLLGVMVLFFRGLRGRNI